MRIKTVLMLFAAIVTASIIPMAFPVQAQTDSGVELVRRFQATATLSADRKLVVTETIAYDFGTHAHHGIDRYIPTSYQRNGGSYDLHLKLLGISMDGAPVPYAIKSRSPEFRVRIGDANRTVTGEHMYVIVYETDRAINFFNANGGKEGELYWNVTGNEWGVPILSATFSVTGPSSYDASLGQKACFTGPAGSTQSDCSIESGAHAVTVSTDRELPADNGLTVAIRFPAGVITPPTFVDQVMMIVVDNWVLVLPFLVFAFMYWRWWNFGREPKGRGTVVPQYEAPRNLAPMEMQALMKQDVASSGITSTIIDLARRGYLKIHYEEKKGIFGKESYSFELVKAPDESLLPFERTILAGIFSSGMFSGLLGSRGRLRGSVIESIVQQIGSASSESFNPGKTVSLEDLSGKLQPSLTMAKNQAFRRLRENGLFGQSPYTVRAAYSGVAAFVLFAGFWAAQVIGILAGGAMVVSAIIIGIFGWFMPAKTPEGAAALEEVEGFKWFLSVTEKDRLAFVNAPKLKPEQFHAFLPAAIAFGVETEWAKQFVGMNVPPPSYVTGYPSTWDVIMFTHLMHTMDTRAAAVAYRPPSQAGSGGSAFGGGGGFSGGGFGGGGGGSW